MNLSDAQLLRRELAAWQMAQDRDLSPAQRRRRRELWKEYDLEAKQRGLVPRPRKMVGHIDKRVMGLVDLWLASYVLVAIAGDAELCKDVAAAQRIRQRYGHRAAEAVREWAAAPEED